MIKSFGNRGTEDVFNGLGSKQARKVCPRDILSAARRKLDYLQAAKTLGDLVALPADFKRLTGPMAEWCSLRINDRYRLLFKWGKEGAEEVEITDYH